MEIISIRRSRSRLEMRGISGCINEVPRDDRSFSNSATDGSRRSDYLSEKRRRRIRTFLGRSAERGIFFRATKFIKRRRDRDQFIF